MHTTVTRCQGNEGDAQQVRIRICRPMHSWLWCAVSIAVGGKSGGVRFGCGALKFQDRIIYPRLTLPFVKYLKYDKTFQTTHQSKSQALLVSCPIADIAHVHSSSHVALFFLPSDASHRKRLAYVPTCFAPPSHPPIVPSQYRCLSPLFPAISLNHDEHGKASLFEAQGSTCRKEVRWLSLRRNA